ncbi:MAG TPA: hypothetical protein VFH73_06665 [Polyangia bacterium]|nr:hypothetical protein [Polyangia bacterium]
MTGTGGASGSGGTSGGSGGTSGGSGSGGATAGSGGSTAGTGGTDAGTGGKPASDGSASDNATEKPARMCLSALGEAPGGYDWTSGDCCPFEAATAQDWCTHYAAYCKFNYPVMSNLSPGAVPLKDMADCLARFPPLTLKSRACRSNFLCNDSSLGEPPNPKTCDFPDLNRRKCDGL